MTPHIYNIADRTFKKISERVYHRDFYLWLNNSDDIDDSILGINLHIRPLDILFSLLLLIEIIAMPLAESILF